eukprot:2341593-Amphidinium_carterae.1
MASVIHSAHNTTVCSVVHPVKLALREPLHGHGMEQEHPQVHEVRAVESADTKAASSVIAALNQLELDTIYGRIALRLKDPKQLAQSGQWTTRGACDALHSPHGVSFCSLFLAGRFGGGDELLRETQRSGKLQAARSTRLHS